MAAALMRLLLISLLVTIPITCAWMEEAPPPRVGTTGLCLPNQSSALLRFKHSIQNFLLPGKLSSWRGNGSDCCHWEGVTCDDRTGFVIALLIPEVTDLFYYIGSIHSSMFELKYLQHLVLRWNQFGGAIPKRLADLTHLAHLDLSRCSFSGQVPVELSHMTRLVSLDLSFNEDLRLQELDFTALVKGLPQLQHLVLDSVHISMSGRDVSAALSSSSLQNLQTLSLLGCNISGPLDDSLFHLRSLSHLDLSANGLKRVPKFLENLTSLNVLELASCELQGSFPRNVFMLPKLETLDISGNDVVVSLPTENLTRSINIRNLDLSRIKGFSDDRPHLNPQSNGTNNGGSIRTSFQALSSNTPPGTIPEALCSFTHLTSLTLTGNSLNGTIPACLLNHSSLEELDLSGNSLNGMLPTYPSSSSSLQYLDLSSNYLSGSIPSSLFTLPSLVSLRLADNMLNGSLPALYHPNSNLETLSLSDNQLSGDISSFMKKLLSLQTVELSSNYFSGVISIPLLSNLKNLTDLDVSNNKRLRAETSNFAHDYSLNVSQLQSLNMRSCDIQCFPRFICQLQALYGLDLSYNNLEGKIPSCLWSISGLTSLSLGHNKLDGFEESANVTRSIGSQLEMSFRAASNQINGPIPSFLCNFTSQGLNYFDMSNNALTGAIPHCLYQMNIVKLGNNQLGGEIPTTGSICNLELLDWKNSQVI